jgi:hypothetical protein
MIDFKTLFSTPVTITVTNYAITVTNYGDAAITVTLHLIQLR